MSAILTALYNSGNLIHDWDFRRGSLRDWGVANTGETSTTTGLKWTNSAYGKNLTGGVSDDCIATANTLSRITGAITILWFGEVTQTIASQVFISKRSVGTTNYEMFQNTTTLCTYDSLGAVNSWTVDTRKAKMIGFTCVGAGSVPVGYVDGASIGSGSSAMTFNATNDNIYLFNSYAVNVGLRIPTVRVLVFNVALTSGQVLQIYQDMQRERGILRIPRKNFVGSTTLRYQLPLIDCPVTTINASSGYVSETDFRVVSGVWKLSQETTSPYRKRITSIADGVCGTEDCQEAFGTFYMKWRQESLYLSSQFMVTASVPGAYNAAGQNGYMFSIGWNGSWYWDKIVNGAASVIFANTNADAFPVSTDMELCVTIHPSTKVHTLYMRGGIITNWTKMPVNLGVNGWVDSTFSTSRGMNAQSQGANNQFWDFRWWSDVKDPTSVPLSV